MDPVTPIPSFHTMEDFKLRHWRWGNRTDSTLGHHVSHNRSMEQKCIEASQPSQAFVSDTEDREGGDVRISAEAAAKGRLEAAITPT
ncbi:hypothetical protein Baya_8849 [Bagarius yarrelli]|uniref:Uncharacterized protein n=1 Tax=Bagarius yarrelli TaxID=175774 RepID=A0A556U9A8_BAGYA|nr:hypothetical protein Baya_8849 [Bagarius yarrelli]